MNYISISPDVAVLEVFNHTHKLSTTFILPHKKRLFSSKQTENSYNGYLLCHWNQFEWLFQNSNFLGTDIFCCKNETIEGSIIDGDGAFVATFGVSNTQWIGPSVAS